LIYALYQDILMIDKAMQSLWKLIHKRNLKTFSTPLKTKLKVICYAFVENRYFNENLLKIMKEISYAICRIAQTITTRKFACH